MSDTAVRYISMLQLIPRFPRTINAGDLQTALADQGFKINMRSIQRDLEKLSAYFPLIADESVRPFAWSFDAGAAARIFPMLDMPAAVTFELARAYLQPVLPPKVLAHLEPHFKDAQRVLKRNGSALAHWPEKIRVISRGLDSKRPALDADVLESVTQALMDGQQCQVEYFGRRWAKTELITVHPLGLVFRDPNTYLIATVEGREHVRQLALHRMKSVTITGALVDTPKDFNLDAFIDSGEMHILHSEQPIELKLRCDKPQLAHLMEAPIGEDQTINDISENEFTLTVTIADSQNLRWWLLAHAAHLEIIKPEFLREELVTKLSLALERNKC